MLKTKYDVLTRNGKEQFVMVPMRDFEAMLDRLRDDADFRAIGASKKRNASGPRHTLDEIKRRLGMIPAKRKRRRL
jgi:hypothetical protein